MLLETGMKEIVNPLTDGRSLKCLQRCGFDFVLWDKTFVEHKEATGR